MLKKTSASFVHFAVAGKKKSAHRERKRMGPQNGLNLVSGHIKIRNDIQFFILTGIKQIDQILIQVGHSDFLINLTTYQNICQGHQLLFLYILLSKIQDTKAQDFFNFILVIKTIISQPAPDLCFNALSSPQQRHGPWLIFTGIWMQEMQHPLRGMEFHLIRMTSSPENGIPEIKTDMRRFRAHHDYVSRSL